MVTRRESGYSRSTCSSCITSTVTPLFTWSSFFSVQTYPEDEIWCYAGQAFGDYLRLLLNTALPTAPLPLPLQNRRPGLIHYKTLRGERSSKLVHLLWFMKKKNTGKGGVEIGTLQVDSRSHFLVHLCSAHLQGDEAISKTVNGSSNGIYWKQ